MTDAASVTETDGVAVTETDDVTARRIDARTWMQAARALVIDRFPYLDVAVTSMVMVPVPDLGTVAVDRRWRLYYDPERVLRLVDEHGVSMLCSDWIHEVMHLLRDHPGRWDELRERSGRQPIFNIAGDALVNDDVARLGLPLLDTDVTFRNLPRQAQCHAGMMTEEIYRRLLPFYEAHSTGGSTSSDGLMSGHDCGSGAGGVRRPWESSIEGEGEDDDDGSVDSARSMSIREVTAMQVLAADSPHHGLRTWAQSLLDPQVNWREELRSVVSRRLGLTAGVRDYSFARPSRRKVPGFTLPGMTGPGAPRVTAIVDTSGSMTHDQLTMCLTELLGLVRTRTSDSPRLTVISCDLDVRNVQTISTASGIKSLTLGGGGGTDMGAGLAWVAAHRPLPDVVVVLTDGETPWPDTCPAGLGGVLVIACLIRLRDGDGALERQVPPWIRTLSISWDDEGDA